MGWTIGNNNSLAKGVVLVKNTSQDTILINQLKYNGRNTVKSFFNQMTLLPEMGLPVEWTNNALEKVYHKDIGRLCSDMTNEKYIEARFEILYTLRGTQKRKQVVISLNSDDLRNCPPNFSCCSETKIVSPQTESKPEAIPHGTYVTVKDEFVTEFKGSFTLVNNIAESRKIVSLSDMKEQIQINLWSPVSGEETMNNEYSTVSSEQVVFVSYKGSFITKLLPLEKWKRQFKRVKIQVGYANGSKGIVKFNCSENHLIRIIE